MNTEVFSSDYLDIVFEDAMENDHHRYRGMVSDDNMFDQYQSYIMDNADPSEVTICNGDTLLEAAESGYLLEEFKSSWMEKELAA